MIAVLLVLAVVPIVLGLAAQFWIRRRYAASLEVAAVTALTGIEVAQRLAAPGSIVAVTDGELDDHYDPRNRTIRLSQQVAGSGSVGAYAIAAHEAGHAAQHAAGDRMFRLRGALVPAAFAGGYGWSVLLVIGVAAQSLELTAAALALFSAVLLFELVTLPVEIDASRRALVMLTDRRLLDGDEMAVARLLLKAAELTYVAAALAAAAEVAWWILQIAFEAHGD